jgi:hypothetical protein
LGLEGQIIPGSVYPPIPALARCPRSSHQSVYMFGIIALSIVLDLLGSLTRRPELITRFRVVEDGVAV